MDDVWWYDDYVQALIDWASDLFYENAPGMPDDGWFTEPEPGVPVEPEWFVEEWVGLYGGRAGG